MRITNSIVALLAEELNNELALCRIDRIRQPAADLLIFDIKGRGENRRLLLSAVAGNARVHFTDCTYESPEQAPMFCMLLRKHISGAVVTSVTQANEDRIIALELLSSDEIGRKQEYTLYVEMMPSSSNIILVDSQGLITDCIRRRDYDAEMYRRVFPGMIYRLPRKPEGFRKSDEAAPELGGSVSAALDAYYSAKERSELFSRTGKELRTAVSSAVKRTARKLEARRNELFATENREEYRRKADLIVSNIYRIKKGDTVLVCEDFYSDYETVSIALDPMLSPQDNAARLYREYNRKKTAAEHLQGLIKEAEEQLDYLKSVCQELEMAISSAELDEIRSELISTGYLKKSRGKKRKSSRAAPIKYKTDSGFDILVGKSNLQNEEITFKTAVRNDLWFHAKDYHGSHVVLLCAGFEPDDESVYKAAELAAVHSEAKGGCAVDYTPVRNVKKRRNGMPGQVTYTDYKTLIIKDTDNLSDYH